MTYEYNLRGLFRPPIDHLPPSSQLPFYRQRDLVPSHLYRLGTGIFGSEPLRRRRVFDASLYSPPQKTPHSTLLKRSVDGRPVPLVCSRLDAQSKEKALSLRDQLNEGRIVGESFTEAQYKQWLSNRQSMRSNLESLGANEQWLLFKERTPLENTLLSQLREKGKAAKSGVEDREKTEPCIGSSKHNDKPTTPDSSKKMTIMYKKQILKEVSQLEQHLSKHRQRLVTLLMAVDKNRDYLITTEEFLMIVDKLRAPISQDALEILLTATTQDNQLDYRMLLSGSLWKVVNDHFQNREEESAVSAASMSENSSKELQDLQATDSKDVLWTSRRQLAPSTMDGQNGELSDAYKLAELKQFDALITYCKDNGIILNYDTAEKALLLPADHPREECLASLRQLRSHYSDFVFNTPEEEDEKIEHRSIREEFGGAYKGLSGRRKARYMRLSTGGATVKAKTDCWLTFEEFQKLTKHIRSRPGFKYKFHGLPDNNAFWPGALLDKLRLWHPSETLQNKPCSLYNIFQPVQHPKIYNPHSPVVKQKTSWPENESGYVQFGSESRKRYHM